MAAMDGRATEAGAGRDKPMREPRDGREVVFARLYEQRYLPMVRLATLLVDRVELAGDITQDAYAAVYRRWDQIDEPAAYLRLTIVNRSRDALRRRRLDRERPVTSPSVVDTPDEFASLLASIPVLDEAAWADRMPLGVAEAVLAAEPGVGVTWYPDKGIGTFENIDGTDPALAGSG